MKSPISLTVITLLLAASDLPAATLYVSLASTNPTPPYSDWATAATTIQDAVSAAVTNDVVVVTNGVYPGGVMVTNPLTLVSVNGPRVTLIDGGGTSTCVGLTDGASLTGFTLTNRNAWAAGGVSCASTNAILTNCVITACYARWGGGAFGGTLYNCTLAGNSAYGAVDWSFPGHYYPGLGGGACGSTLYNCTLTGNSADEGGGAWGSRLYNCIVYFNTASGGANYDSSSVLNYCCTTPLPPDGVGNIDLEPAFVNPGAGDFHLRYGSPCIDAGTNLSDIITNDLDGNPRPLDGNGDGVAAFDIGAYEFVPPARYVWPDSPNPSPPFRTWASAAHSIQTAMDAAQAGDAVLVTNSVYPGGVNVTNPLTLVSLNGPQVTIIDGGGTNRCVSLCDGASLTGFTLTNGYTYSEDGGGVWCSSTNAFLTNCVLTGNSSRRCYDNYCGGGWGGGAIRANLYNCTLTGNSAVGGGGAYGATLYNCTLTGNSAACGGGALLCTLSNCTLSGNSTFYLPGGGASACTLYNCTLTANSAVWYGGGAGPDLNGTPTRLYNCTLSGNTAEWGGGAWGSTLYNSTVVDNVASDSGGGVAASTLANCIVAYNAAWTDDNYTSDSTLNFCCTEPRPTNGVGNISVRPQFADYAGGNLRLQSDSPCINAGNNAYVTTITDLDGTPRIVSGTVDIGAYEYQGTGSVISYAWLQQYILPTDGSADFIDSDGDGLTNWEEWICGTSPTTPLSALRMVSAFPSGTTVTVTWESVTGVNYFLECSTNLAASPCFRCVATNIVGQPGTTTYADTNATGPGPFFYRVGVASP